MAETQLSKTDQISRVVSHPHIKYHSIADQVRALRHLSNVQIAERLGCSLAAVLKHRRKMEGAQPCGRGWTDDRVATLKILWAYGLSASQIAGRMGGVTRNSVISKVHRLGLAGRATTSRLNPNKKIKPPAKRPKVNISNPSFRKLYLADAESYVPPAEELVIPVNERKTIATLTETSCRWPIGDVGHPDFHFCGKKKIDGLPYCEHHCRRAFAPPQPRRQSPTPREDNVIVLAKKESVAA